MYAEDRIPDTQRPGAIEKRKEKRKRTAAAVLSEICMKSLCSFNLAGSQAGSTNVHLLCTSIYLYSDRFDIRLPHFIRSSMGVAHLITKMSALIANCTFSHDSTSLLHISPCLTCKDCNNRILAEIILFCKCKIKKDISFFLKS